MPRTFVTSDTHFGHKNIIRYTHRPFKSSQHMDAAMIAAWNERVGEDDIVYHLGDFAMGPGVDFDFIEAHLQMLNGQIKFVLGNHDMPSKWTEGLEKCLEIAHAAGRLDRVEILGDESVSFQHDGKRFVLYHYPMVDWDGRFKGTVHLHGHTHGRVVDQFHDTEWEDPAQPRLLTNGKWMISHVPHENNRYDVGVDAYGGPVELTGDLRYLNNPRGWV